jgi:hypothetical protein
VAGRSLLGSCATLSHNKTLNNCFFIGVGWRYSQADRVLHPGADRYL